MIILTIITALFLIYYYKKYKDFMEALSRAFVLSTVIYVTISTVYLFAFYDKIASQKEEKIKIVKVEKNRYWVGDTKYKFNNGVRVIPNFESDSSYIYKRSIEYYSKQKLWWLIVSFVPKVNLEESIYLKKEDWEKFSENR